MIEVEREEKKKSFNDFGIIISLLAFLTSSQRTSISVSLKLAESKRKSRERDVMQGFAKKIVDNRFGEKRRRKIRKILWERWRTGEVRGEGYDLERL